MYRNWLALAAGLALVGDTVYGIALYRRMSPSIETLSALHIPIMMICFFLIVSGALIFFSDYMPRRELAPFSSMRFADPRVMRFLGWMLAWFLLLVVTPVILHLHLAR